MAAPTADAVAASRPSGQPAVPTTPDPPAPGAGHVRPHPRQRPAGGPLLTALTNASNRPYVFQTRSVAGRRYSGNRARGSGGGEGHRRNSVVQRRHGQRPVTPLVARTPGLRVAAGRP